MDLNKIITSPYVVVSFKICLATVIGAIIGYDREIIGKPAGIKTHALVCLGSCMVMSVGVSTFSTTLIGDPMRLAAQVVSGMGFLCGGVIIVTAKNEIKGLTTAAGLWFAACMGLVVGSDFTWITIPTTICYYVITHVLSRLDRKIRKKQKEAKKLQNETDIHLRDDDQIVS